MKGHECVENIDDGVNVCCIMSYVHSVAFGIALGNRLSSNSVYCGLLMTHGITFMFWVLTDH